MSKSSIIINLNFYIFLVASIATFLATSWDFCAARSSGGTTTQTRTTPKPKPPGKPLKKAVSCSPVPIKPTSLPKGTDPRAEYVTGGLFTGGVSVSFTSPGTGGGPIYIGGDNKSATEITPPNKDQLNTSSW